MSERTVFTSVTLYDGRNPKQTNMTVTVEDNAFVAVTKGVPDDRGGRHVDLGGRTIMPGMTVGHWHGEFADIGPPHFAAPEEGRGGLFLGTEQPPAILALQAADALRVALMSGVMRVVGGSCSHNFDWQMKLAIERGMIIGPHITPGSRHVVTTGDYEDRGRWWNSPALPIDGVRRYGHNVFADGPEQMVKAVRQEILFGAEVIKILPSGGHGFEWISRYRGLSAAELKAVVETAHERNVRVRAHVATKEAIMECIEAGVDILDHCDYMDEECIAAMVEKKVFFVASQLFSKMISPAANGAPRDMAKAADRAWFNMLEMLPKANAAGVKIVSGDDFGARGMPHALGEYARELEVYVKDFGISAEDVIRWTTVNGAELALLGDKTGSIEPGKAADFIVVDGDPGADIGLLRNVDNLKAIVHNGRFVKDELAGASPAAERQATLLDAVAAE